MHVAGVRADAGDLRARRPGGWSATARDLLVSELAGKGDGRREGRRRWASSVDDAAARGSSSASRSSSTRGYQFEAADGSLRAAAAQGGRRLRAAVPPGVAGACIVEQRADGKVETEATIKIWVDGERYVRTAEGNGPVNALDRALRDALGRDPPAPRATSSSSTSRSASSTRRRAPAR